MIGWFEKPGGPGLAELVVQGLSSIEGGYDRLAAKFDHSVFRTPDPVLQVLAQHIPSCPRALDIGCGTGAILQLLQPRVDNLVGLDLSRNMLDKARQNLGPGPQLIQGDFLKTYWEDAFWLVTSVGVLGHIALDQQDLFFQRLRLALKPGGIFLTVVGDLSQRPWLYLPALAFDSVMKVRNLLWRPTFVMYYLNFILPRAEFILRRHGFKVEIIPGQFPVPFSQLNLLKATKA